MRMIPCLQQFLMKHATKIGSLDGQLFLFWLFSAQYQDGTYWPPKSPKWKCWLLWPLYKLNNKLVLSQYKHRMYQRKKI